MAKTNEQFDRIFKEKLEGHQEKPSALAWERLESQLPKTSKSGWGVWWAIAASVTALLVAYLIWPNSGQISEESLLAQTEELVEETISESESTQTEVATPVEDAVEEIKTENKSTETLAISKSNPKTEAPAIQKSQQQEVQIKQLIAEANPAQNEQKTSTQEVPEVKISEPEMELPSLKAPELNKTVAEAKSTSDDQPLYRVSIFSNGIKKGDAVDKNLITELGKTVGHVEGLLGKVDEGFAEIQDKKDNLFATLTTRKERADQ